MWWDKLFRLALGLVLLACGALAPTTSVAATEDLSRAQRNACLAYSNKAGPIAATNGPATRWDCRNTRPDLWPERVFMRFAIAPSESAPRYFVTSRAPFAAFHVFADGRWQSFGPSDFEPATAGAMMRVALPAHAVQDNAITVAVDRPTSRMMLEQAQVAPPADHPDATDQRDLLLLAALCGVMLMPLIFNVAFYNVLRERFILWHCVLALSLTVSVFIKSPLANQLTGLSVVTLSSVATLAFGTAMGAAGMFGYSFIERRRLAPWLRKALPVAAATAFLAAILHAFWPFVLRGVQTDLFYFTFGPVALVYILALCNSIRMRSRAGTYQLIGWSVLIGAGIIRIVSALTPSLHVTDAMPLFYIGCIVEMVGTTLGVADRFMAIKTQRDRAVRDAVSMERRAGRDPLTGLANRRLLESQFAELRQRGYNALGVIDIDHFKAVNDTFGHKRGDEVLCAVATALAAGKDVRTFRLGGEEFVILLRGANTPLRAEGRRLAITSSVARDVVGLDRLVTASMGLIELPPGKGFHIDFADAYECADKLLYEAKSAGRNRMVSEKLTLFDRQNEPALRKGAA